MRSAVSTSESIAPRVAPLAGGMGRSADRSRRLHPGSILDCWYRARAWQGSPPFEPRFAPMTRTRAFRRGQLTGLIESRRGFADTDKESGADDRDQHLQVHSTPSDG
jgi:hypothetical protein